MDDGQDRKPHQPHAVWICTRGILQAGRDVQVCKGDTTAIRKTLPPGIRHTADRRTHRILGCRSTGVEKLPAGEFSGMETDQLTIDN